MLLSFKKVANLMPPKMPQASAKPARITPTTPPNNPVFGMGQKKQPFGAPLNRFGTTARKGLVSRTAAIKGIKI